MNKSKFGLLLAVVASCVAVSADTSSAGLAKLSGGSGYSGNLSKNKSIRQEELICDPAGVGDPTYGSTSVTYDPSCVTFSGLDLGPGYTGQGVIEVQPSGGGPELQSIASFLATPDGVETGYIQVSYTLSGTPGTMAPQAGFTQINAAGVTGVDTDSLLFNYVSGVPNSQVASYTIYADPGGDAHAGNNPDLLAGIGPGGATFTLGPSQLSSATVSGSLDSPATPGNLAVPLPPAVWTGSAMLLALVSVTAVRKARRA